ncbi:MAG: hypothetical protein OXC31_14735 [Spirochaetaceae bacterium]|nr:hypothetical protein [Spirochaetaceae bacterium]
MFLMAMALAVAMVACQAATPVEKTPVTLGGTGLPDMSFSDFEGTAAAKTVTITGNHFKGTKLDYKASSSNSDVATATASGSTVTVTPKGVGRATVTVIATATADNEQGTASLNFTVTVTAPPPPEQPEPPPDNNAPRLKAGKTLPHHTELLFGGSEEVDLDEYFTDDEDDDITYVPVSNDEGVVTVSVSGSMLTITVVNHGDTTIIVTATDSYNQSIKEAFDVTVINQAPMIVADEPTRFGPYMPGDTQKITVSEYFTDVEGDDLKYTAAPSDETAAEFVTVTDPDADSNITITAKAVGEAMITITATDGTSVTSHTLTVTVDAVPNQAPEVVGDGIPDQSLELDFADKMKTLDNLSMYFRDPDAGPNPTLEYEVSVPAMGMGMYANATVDGETLMITAVAAGDEMITVTAFDGRHRTSDTFTVTVTNPPAPTPTSDLPDVHFAHDDMAAPPIMLSEHFSGATDYDVSVRDDGVVTATKAQDESGEWALTLTPGDAGRTVVTVTPTNSAGRGAAQSFTVIVDPMPSEPPAPPEPNKPPQYKPDMTLSNMAPIQLINGSNATGAAGPDDADDSTDEEFGAAAMDNKDIELDMYFTDPDGVDSRMVYAVTMTEMPDEADKKPVIQLHSVKADTTTTAATGDHAKGGPPDGEDEDERMLVIEPRNLGTATITITVTDEDGETDTFTFTVEVVASGTNDDPVIGSVADTATSFPDLVGSNTADPAAQRLTIDGTPRKVVNDALISTLFDDPDFRKPDRPDEMLKLSVKYFPLDIGIDEATRQAAAANPDTKVLAADKVGVSHTPSALPSWNGSSRAKLTLSLAGTKGTPMGADAGAETDDGHLVALIATDEYGRSFAHVLQVIVNHAPEAIGPQEDDAKTLGEAMCEDSDCMELGFDSRTSPDGTPFPAAVTANQKHIPLVSADGTAGGYFHDPDGNDTALVCRINGKTGTDAFKFTLQASDGAPDDTSLRIETLKARGSGSVTIACRDAYGDSSPDATLRVRATHQSVSLQ